MLRTRAIVIAAAAVCVIATGTYGCSSDDQTPSTIDESTENSASLASESATEDPMNEEIQNLIQTYQRSLNEGDVDLVRTVYADDAMFMGQTFPSATGIEEIAALYADFFSHVDFDIQFDVQDIELSGDLGFVRTLSHGTITPKGQDPGGTEGNREIFVVKKVDGVWKFYRYIFNAEV